MLAQLLRWAGGTLSFSLSLSLSLPSALARTLEDTPIRHLQRVSFDLF